MTHELEKARLLAGEGRFTEALELYDGLLRGGHDEKILWERIRLLRDMGQPAAAQRALLQLLSAAPENPRWLNALAVLEAEQGHLIDSLATFAQAQQFVTSDPAWRAAVTTNMAAAYFESGWPEDGLAQSRDALALDRDLRRAHFLIGLNAPAPTRVEPQDVFRSDPRLHVYPYLNFDLSWRETRWTIDVTEISADQTVLKAKVPQDGAEEHFRLTAGRRVIGGAALDEAFYGSLFVILTRSGPEIELSVPAGGLRLTRVQRRGHLRTANLDPIAEIAVKNGDSWRRVPKSEFSVVDISATGMRLRCRTPLRYGQPFRVTFQLERERFHSEAVVRRMDPQQTYGVQFILPGERELERLHKAVFQAHLEQIRRVIRP
jgi:hypothetical protein